MCDDGDMDRVSLEIGRERQEVYGDGRTRRMMPLAHRNNAEVMDVVFSSLRYHIGQDQRY
jgi:hypothetical protein